MALQEQSIRLTFGLKLRQLRQEKGFSLQELSQRTGISISYLNEIEKGKKYPKADKILLLAEALSVSYDWLVSLQLHPKLAPLAELLQSNILQELPLDMLGIDRAKLLELLAEAPARLSAFISTLIEISRSYDMQVEQFYFSVLRSYQEMHDNYFEELEQAAKKFCEMYLPELRTDYLSTTELTLLLEQKFHTRVEYVDMNRWEALRGLRSVFLPQQQKLLINQELSQAQKRFVLARELGFAYLQLKIRPYTFSWVRVSAFEEVLNNFKASYFAGALLIPEQQWVGELQQCFSKPHWQAHVWLKWLEQYIVTPETLMHRLTNLLPRHWQLNELFFLRFSMDANSQKVQLSKEMHLGQLHNPHASALHEHYCRRWISWQILHSLPQDQQQGYLCRAQISDYIDSPNRYFVMTMARSMYPTPASFSSVSVGILLNPHSQNVLRFVQDSKLVVRQVGETCERCSAITCRERAAPPAIWQSKQLQARRQEDLQQLLKAYGEI